MPFIGQVQEYHGMKETFSKYMTALGICSALLLSGQALAETAPATQKHTHAHDHSHGHDKDIYKGYFKDSQVEDRKLSDWEGDWQSVYPYLLNGMLDPVFAHKAEHGDKSAKQYREYYEIGYRTDVTRIVIDGNKVSFHKGKDAVSGHYTSDGFEILTYAKGNRGVRYIFKKVDGDKAAPQYMQFSDHRIAPAKADHYHLYWGDDRKALLNEVTNWPTYYGSSLTGEEIAGEMITH